MMETRKLQPFQSVAQVASFFEDLAQSDCATTTLKYVLAPVLRVVFLSTPRHERKLKFKHELCQSAERFIEKLNIELTGDAFSLEWHWVRAGALVRIYIERTDSLEPEYRFNLLYSADVSGTLAEIVAWILDNRSPATLVGVLAKAG